MTSRLIIYGLRDPRTKFLKYIGRSSSGLRRPRTHLCRSVYEHGRYEVYSWIRALHAEGMVPDILVLQECESADELDDAETEQIAYFKFCGAVLTNMTSGGSGTRAVKSRKGQKGHTPTKETREQISKSLKKFFEDPANRESLRHNMTAEQRKAAAERMAAYNRTPESARRVGDRLAAMWKDPSYRARFDEFLSKPRPYRFKEVFADDGRVFESNKACAAALGVKASAIAQALSRNRPCKGVLLSRYPFTNKE